MIPWWVTSCLKIQRLQNKVRTEKESWVLSHSSAYTGVFRKSVYFEIYAWQPILKAKCPTFAVTITTPLTKNVNMATTVSQGMLKFTRGIPTSDRLLEWEVLISTSIDNCKDDSEFQEAGNPTMSTSPVTRARLSLCFSSFLIYPWDQSREYCVRMAW